jgi:oligosaccharide reducing-end xylanase
MKHSSRILAIALLLTPACGTVQQTRVVAEGDSVTTAAPTPVARSGVYRNLFREIGKTDTEIDAKVDAAVHDFFFGDDTIRCYETLGSDEAYILDSGNDDVRSEGMSYGMMTAVQAGRRTEFDRLWNYARRRMCNGEGDRQGYFAWKASRDGEVLDPNPAPDGEEYFAMALFFA